LLDFILIPVTNTFTGDM